MGETPLALLLTDVVDSTRTNERVGDTAMARWWARHDAAARALMAQWRGREVGRTDGFLIVFESADDAAAFALAYHREIERIEPPMRARAGLHFGAVRLRRNAKADIERGATPFEVDGVALPVAARVMSAAMGGQTLLSGDAFAALTRPAAARARAHGHWRVKGIADPIEIVEIGDENAPLAPPPDSDKAYRVVRDGQTWISARDLPSHLPAERDRFIGRGEALREVAARVDRGARLVTLAGIGGIGKTRLALRYARGWLGDFDGGAWFCDLAAARGLDGVVHAVAQGLEVTLGRADPVRQLAGALAGRGHCLVVVDNFEQVVDFAEATLGAWLEAAPQAVFVVTSRTHVNIAGEQVLPIEPLTHDEAKAMFVERARAAGRPAAGDAAETASIGPLVDLLDRLPLAIELAASRARLMSPATLLRRMGERFDLLARHSRPHDRQATLRAALDWSWQLLSAAERSALVQLTVFDAGFTLDTAQAVLDTAGGIWAPDLVQSLLEKSLLRTRSGERLDMLVTVQQYATERGRAEAAAALGDAARRHWAHFAAFDERRALAERCVEADNLVTACRRATAAGDADAALDLLATTWFVLRATGPYRAAVELAKQVLDMPVLRADQRARALTVAGSAQTSLGRTDEARALLVRALAALPAACRARAEALLALGQLESIAGDAGQAAALLAEALALACNGDTASLHCRVLMALGALASESSRLEEARAYDEAALAIARGAGDRRREGLLLGNLGALHHQLGHQDAAAAAYEQAAALALQVGDRAGEGHQRSNLGLLRLEQGRLDEARRELAAAASIAAAMGHVRLQGVTQCNLGLAFEAEDRLEPALAAFEAALATAGDDRRAQGQYRVYVGRTLLRLGRTAAADDCLAAAADLLAGGANSWAGCLLRCADAELAARLGDGARAQRSIEQAGRLLEEAGSAAGELARAYAQAVAAVRAGAGG